MAFETDDDAWEAAQAYASKCGADRNVEDDRPKVTSWLEEHLPSNARILDIGVNGTQKQDDMEVDGVIHLPTLIDGVPVIPEKVKFSWEQVSVDVFARKYNLTRAVVYDVVRFLVAHEARKIINDKSVSFRVEVERYTPTIIVEAKGATDEEISQAFVYVCKHVPTNSIEMELMGVTAVEYVVDFDKVQGGEKEDELVEDGSEEDGPKLTEETISTLMKKLSASREEVIRAYKIALIEPMMETGRVRGFSNKVEIDDDGTLTVYFVRGGKVDGVLDYPYVRELVESVSEQSLRRALQSGGQEAAPCKVPNVIVDGNNVLRGDDEISPCLLIALAKALKKADITSRFYFDANVEFLIDKADEKIKSDWAKFKTENENLIKIVPGGSQADEFILMKADKEGSHIISNDRYRDREHLYAWIGNREERRLHKFTVDEGTLMIPDLGIYETVE